MYTTHIRFWRAPEASTYFDSNHTKENTNRNDTQQAGARHYHVLRPKVMPKIENLRPFFWVPVSSFSALLA